MASEPDGAVAPDGATQPDGPCASKGTRQPAVPVEHDRGAEELLAISGDELAGAAQDALGGWVRRCVELRASEAGVVLAEDQQQVVEVAGERAAAEVGGRLRSLLAADLDEQRGSPLEVLRSAAGYPGAVLRHLGVPPVVRDDFAQRQFPDDDYDLTPASFADVHESLHELGIRWGAAKAQVHLARRRAAHPG